METKNVVHSKYKNPGILFELLVRQITVDTLDGKEVSPATNILRKYFHPKTELGKELQLYRSFFEISRLTEVKAAQFIDLISTQRKRLDNKRLAAEKYELIKEIKKSYNLDSFLRADIPSYKIYASIYKMFLAEAQNFNIANIRDVATSQFTIIEHLMRDPKIQKKKVESNIFEIFKSLPEDERLLAYKGLLTKFNTKYDGMSSPQKQLLREYINSVSNSDDFLLYFRNQLSPLRSKLIALSEKENDKVLKIKINEVANQLESLKARKKVGDKELAALMVAYQLESELAS